MIEVKITDSAQEQANKLRLDTKLKNKIEIFKVDRSAAALKNKKLEPKKLNRWQFNLDKKHRARYVFNKENQVEIYAVGDFHDER